MTSPDRQVPCEPRVHSANQGDRTRPDRLRATVAGARRQRKPGERRAPCVGHPSCRSQRRRRHHQRPTRARRRRERLFYPELLAD